MNFLPDAEFNALMDAIGGDNVVIMYRSEKARRKGISRVYEFIKSCHLESPFICDGNLININDGCMRFICVVDTGHLTGMTADRLYFEEKLEEIIDNVDMARDKIYKPLDGHETEETIIQYMFALEDGDPNEIYTFKVTKKVIGCE